MLDAFLLLVYIIFTHCSVSIESVHIIVLITCYIYIVFIHTFENLDTFAIFFAENTLSFNKKSKFWMFYIEMLCKQSITYGGKKPVLSVDVHVYIHFFFNDLYKITEYLFSCKRSIFFHLKISN